MNHAHADEHQLSTHSVRGPRLGGGRSDPVRIVRDVEPVPVTAFERDSVLDLIEAKKPTGPDFDRIPTAMLAMAEMGVITP